MPASEGAGSQEQRQEETTNYEISKTVRTLIREQPQIDRISLAVMVDGTDSAAPTASTPGSRAPAEELDRITGLVRSAIGYDEKRGDQVEVVSMRFAADDDGTGRGQRRHARPAVWRRRTCCTWRRPRCSALIGVLALLLVLRPMVLRLTSVGAPRHCRRRRLALARGRRDGRAAAGAGAAAAPLGCRGGATRCSRTKAW